VLRVVARGVDGQPAVGVAEHRVDELMAERARGFLVAGDRLLGEGRQQQLARVVVERRVGGDRRADADRGRVVRG
jgi:hypothetical protein